MTELLVYHKPMEDLRGIIRTAADYELSGNLWKSYLALHLITVENTFSLGCERNEPEKGGLYDLAFQDIKAIWNLYFNPPAWAAKAGTFSPVRRMKNEKSRIGALANDLCTRLSETRTAAEFFETVVAFYRKNGVGTLGLSAAFELADTADGFEIKPLSNMTETRFSDLWGYEIQKKQLIDNTESFLKGKSANNVLLFGDAGTGKSTCIKALLNEYSKDGLKIIEVYKHQFGHLKKLIRILEQRNCHFIIYMDDLSFEEFEIEYKYLKAVIEGGLEPKPKNVLIYATSNRRHLIRETWSDKSDRDEDLHHSDTEQEKLSLADRFGVSICFVKPLLKDYNEIVLHLAHQSGIKMPQDELLQKARAWSVSHAGTSGRVARQFIDSLK